MDYCHRCDRYVDTDDAEFIYIEDECIHWDCLTEEEQEKQDYTELCSHADIVLEVVIKGDQ